MEKNINFTRVVVTLALLAHKTSHSQNKCFFLLAGHKVDFIAPCGTNKSTFWPASRKKIVCNTGKTFILLMWLLTSLCSGIKLHTRKINFFFPSCTMYYFRIARDFLSTRRSENWFFYPQQDNKIHFMTL